MKRVFRIGGVASVAAGLYLRPPENALVLSVDEKSQIQALAAPSRDCRSKRAAAAR